jgi:hypothetical protein
MKRTIFSNAPSGTNRLTPAIRKCLREGPHRETPDKFRGGLE